MSPPVLERVRSIIHRAKTTAKLRRRSTISVSTQKQSIWRRLPDSVLVRVLAQCELQDIYSLLLSCRILRRRVSRLEYAISQAYLHHRTQPSQYITETGHELVPSVGDDLTFIASLFPPPPPQYTSTGVGDDLPEYSFGYLADLTRCWKTCIKLSYYLAEYVVHQHLVKDGSWSSKTEKEVGYSKGVGLLQSRLLSPVAYIIFFLETHASEPQPSIRATSSRHQAQQSILQQPPFTNTQTLLATHHAMHLLCSSVRHLMAPDITAASAEAWLALLLTTSTLERIMEFFVAAATDESVKVAAAGVNGHSPTWTNRMEFMWQMRRDWGEFVASGLLAPPKLSEVWFEAAQREICRRGAIPHEGEVVVPVLHGAGVALRCEFCE
ncbi:hypothetical protein BDV37DRAFT_271805 [Aspergillus pseudonomiae]|uniref:F-box domain-containing protein n=1 Tax=Aspergillus pseudonomiae TaxID=1506151 RepID=A0A5N7DBP0_9EURO|nr:uncharacterized protein BDV37DRAFT_271805 [Aspergillus pseudonomiae]KAE8403890.1 hypothetical protein BDV37DRAFT_271805 [Aspergillus pseudonomiae]